MLINGFNIRKGANLSGADLKCANLSDANLIRANLSGANLNGANLNGANLNGASLSDANLKCADLKCANLIRADLSGADLKCANLSDANLIRANLSGANLNGANLNGANLIDTDVSFFNILPEGSIIGWKKLGDYLLKLEIKSSYKRLNSIGSRKCRAEKALIREITNIKINRKVSSLQAGYRTTNYTVGKIVQPDKFDTDIRIECSNGIHFFITKEEALNY